LLEKIIIISAQRGVFISAQRGVFISAQGGVLFLLISKGFMLLQQSFSAIMLIGLKYVAHSRHQ